MPALALALSSGIGKRKRNCTRNNLCHVQYMKPRERERESLVREIRGERRVGLGRVQFQKIYIQKRHIEYLDEVLNKICLQNFLHR